MDVQLPPDLETFVQSEVRSGRYGSATDVVRDALLLLEEGRNLPDVGSESIRQKIDEGAESLARGEHADGEQVFARLEAHLDLLERRSGKG